MAQYLIKELENLSGIKAHTIRIWEKRYNIIKPARTDTNIRYYCDYDLKKLLNIVILNRNGMKISEIAKLSDEQMTEKVMGISYESAIADNQIENLIIAMVDLDEAKFEKILSRFIMNQGFENAVLKIIFPFFERLGILWQVGSINPVHEHFVSNLFRQKLMVAIDNLDISDSVAAKKFILFLPEGEFHELGLLFYHYIIKKAGHLVYYLGSSVPVNDLIETNKVISPDFLFTSFITSLEKEKSDEYFKTVSKAFPFQTVFITGGQLRDNDLVLPDNYSIISSPRDLHEIIRSI